MSTKNPNQLSLQVNWSGSRIITEEDDDTCTLVVFWRLYWHKYKLHCYTLKLLNPFKSLSDEFHTSAAENCSN